MRFLRRMLPWRSLPATPVQGMLPEAATTAQALASSLQGAAPSGWARCVQRARAAVGRIMNSPKLEAVILVCIALNLVTMTMPPFVGSWDASSSLAGLREDNKEGGMDARWHLAALGIEITCTSAFTLEMMMRMFALGLLKGDKAYWRDPWNRLDFVIVVGSWAALPALLGVAGGNSLRLSSLRALRALRPLRAFKFFSGVRAILASLQQSIPLLADVAGLVLFFFIIFGVLGLEMFMGALARRCVMPDGETLLVPETLCGYGKGSYKCPPPSVCQRWGNPDFGYVSFDNFGAASLLHTKVISLDAWSELMYALMDAAHPAAGLHFVLLVIFVTFIMVNLFVAVINAVFERVHNEHQELLIKSIKGDGSSGTAMEDIPTRVAALKGAWTRRGAAAFAIALFSRSDAGRRSRGSGDKAGGDKASGSVPPPPNVVHLDVTGGTPPSAGDGSFLVLCLGTQQPAAHGVLATAGTFAAGDGSVHRDGGAAMARRSMEGRQPPIPPQVGRDPGNVWADDLVSLPHAGTGDDAPTAGSNAGPPSALLLLSDVVEGDHGKDRGGQVGQGPTTGSPRRPTTAGRVGVGVADEVAAPQCGGQHGGDKGAAFGGVATDSRAIEELGGMGLAQYALEALDVDTADGDMGGDATARAKSGLGPGGGRGGGAAAQGAYGTAWGSKHMPALDLSNLGGSVCDGAPEVVEVSPKACRVANDALWQLPSRLAPSALRASPPADRDLSSPRPSEPGSARRAWASISGAGNALAIIPSLTQISLFLQQTGTQGGYLLQRSSVWAGRVSDAPHLDTFITGCIVLNTVVMAMAYHGMPHEYAMGLDIAEAVFTLVFAAEVCVRMWAMGGPHKYLRKPSNVFDMVIVVPSVVDVAMRVLRGPSQGVQVSVLRFLRLFRVARIARLMREYPAVRKLLNSVFGNFDAVANLMLFIGFIMLVAAVFGMQLFGGRLRPLPGIDDRAGFDNFGYALLTLLQVMTGDRWTILMYRALASVHSGWESVVTAAFFIAFFLFANFVLLNLFVAIILENFWLAEEEKLLRQQDQYLRKKFSAHRVVRRGPRDTAVRTLLMVATVTRRAYEAVCACVARWWGWRRGGGRKRAAGIGHGSEAGWGGPRRESRMKKRSSRASWWARPRSTRLLRSGSTLEGGAESRWVHIHGNLTPDPEATPTKRSGGAPMDAREEGESPSSAETESVSTARLHHRLLHLASGSRHNANGAGCPSCGKPVGASWASAGAELDSPRGDANGLGNPWEALDSPGVVDADDARVPPSSVAPARRKTRLLSITSDDGYELVALDSPDAPPPKGRRVLGDDEDDPSAPPICPLCRLPSQKGLNPAHARSLDTRPLDRSASGSASAPDDAAALINAATLTNVATLINAADLTNLAALPRALPLALRVDVGPPTPTAATAVNDSPSMMAAEGGLTRSTSTASLLDPGGDNTLARAPSGTPRGILRGGWRTSSAKSLGKASFRSSASSSPPRFLWFGGRSLSAGKRSLYGMGSSALGGARALFGGPRDAHRRKSSASSLADDEKGLRHLQQIRASLAGVSGSLRGLYLYLQVALGAVVYNKWFERAMLAVICASSIALALEKPSMDRQLAEVLRVADRVFLAVFWLEFCLKVLARGLVFGPNAYLANGWDRLDFVVLLLTSLEFLPGVSVAGGEGGGRLLRVGRVLRPLRMMRWNDGMRSLINAIVLCVPMFLSVLALAAIIFCVFAILGLNLFAGKMALCTDRDPGAVTGRADCVGTFWARAAATGPSWAEPSQAARAAGAHARAAMTAGIRAQEGWNGSSAAAVTGPSKHASNAGNPAVAGEGGDGGNASGATDGGGGGKAEKRVVTVEGGGNGTQDDGGAVFVLVPRMWRNPDAHFDNSLVSLLTLFRVSSLTGWADVAFASMDVRGEGLAPVTNASWYHALFFCVFVFLGSFFIVKVFIGTIIDSFSVNSGSALLTEKQRVWVDVERLLLKAVPPTSTAKPADASRAFCYGLVTHPAFNHAILTVVTLNTIVIAMQHEGQGGGWDAALGGLNKAFLGLFTAELLAKVVGLGPRGYIGDRWNLFDAVIVVGSYATLFAARQATWVSRLASIFRVGRIVRIARNVAGIRSLLNTLRLSAPYMANITLLLFLLYFIYAVLGVALFGTTRHGFYLTRHANFESFGSAITLLFSVTTGGTQWHNVMDECGVEPPACGSRGVPTLYPSLGVNGSTSGASLDLNLIDSSNSGYYIESDCGNPVLARLYFVSFYIVGTYVFLNLFVAVILENFLVAYDRDLRRILPKDMETFATAWASADGDGRGYILLDQLRALLAEVEPCFGVPPRAPGGLTPPSSPPSPLPGKEKGKEAREGWVLQQGADASGNADVPADDVSDGRKISDGRKCSDSRKSGRREWCAGGDAPLARTMTSDGSGNIGLEGQGTDAGASPPLVESTDGPLPNGGTDAAPRTQQEDSLEPEDAARLAPGLLPACVNEDWFQRVYRESLLHCHPPGSDRLPFRPLLTTLCIFALGEDSLPYAHAVQRRHTLARLRTLRAEAIAAAKAGKKAEAEKANNLGWRVIKGVRNVVRMGTLLGVGATKGLASLALGVKEGVESVAKPGGWGGILNRAGSVAVAGGSAEGDAAPGTPRADAPKPEGLGKLGRAMMSALASSRASVSANPAPSEDKRARPSVESRLEAQRKKAGAAALSGTAAAEADQMHRLSRSQRLAVKRVSAMVQGIEQVLFARNGSAGSGVGHAAAVPEGHPAGAGGADAVRPPSQPMAVGQGDGGGSSPAGSAAPSVSPPVSIPAAAAAAVAVTRANVSVPHRMARQTSFPRSLQGAVRPSRLRMVGMEPEGGGALSARPSYEHGTQLTPLSSFAQLPSMVAIHGDALKGEAFPGDLDQSDDVQPLYDAVLGLADTDDDVIHPLGGARDATSRPLQGPTPPRDSGRDRAKSPLLVVDGDGRAPGVGPARVSSPPTEAQMGRPHNEAMPGLIDSPDRHESGAERTARTAPPGRLRSSARLPTSLSNLGVDSMLSGLGLDVPGTSPSGTAQEETVGALQSVEQGALLAGRPISRAGHELGARMASGRSSPLGNGLVAHGSTRSNDSAPAYERLLSISSLT
eukprot:jgi/Mesvir1/5383/Mv15459-RA.1